MKVTVSKAPKNDTRIVFITEKQKNKPKDFEGKKDEVTIRYEHNNKTILYCGLGEPSKCTTRTLKAAAGTCIRKIDSLKRKKVSVIEPKIRRLKDSAGRAIVEGAILGQYSFTQYKKEKPVKVTALELVSDTTTAAEIKDTVRLCEGIYLARDLINGNANEIYPARLAQEARTIAKASKGISCTVLTEKDIEKKGLGLLKAVGQGSPYPPRLVMMNYTGNPKSKERVAIVGKGITFDSGGQNLKPSKHIETMRCDMSGAAAVLGLMKVLGTVKPKVNVMGVVTAAQNAIGSKAYFPGDTHTSYAGKTVEILNTDAEGRLALVDGISYCIKQYKPTEIIDLATLTGSVVAALGETMAGLFSNNDRMAKKLFDSGEKTGERLWRMPIRDEHRDSLKSDIADLRNISKLPKGYAGSMTAAAFLEAFVEDLPWAHIDIAGTAFNESEARGEISKYGTGFGIRLLMDYLKQK